jgi:hypothetical protein
LNPKLNLPYELLELVNAFPFGVADSPCTKFDFIPYLPFRERAVYLADLYYKNTAWM